MAAEETIAIQQGLSGLSRTLSTELGKVSSSTVSFREAATQNNRNISNIVKDVFVSMASQRKELSETNSNIVDSFSGIQRSVDNNSREIDALDSAMQGILSVEYKNLSELSTISKELSDISDNTSGSVLSALFSNIFSGESFSGALKTAFGLAIGGLAGYLGGGKLAEGLGLGGGAGGGVQQVSNPVMAKDIYDYLTKEKKVDHAHAVGMLANIQNESKFNSGAFNKNDVNGPSGGLFQHHDNYITGERRFTNMVNAVGPDWQKNWKGQIDYALTEPETHKYLSKPMSSGEEAARSFVFDFEKPGDKYGEASRRAGNVPAVERAISQGGITPASGTPTTNVTNTTPTTNITNTATTITPAQSTPDAGRQPPMGVPPVTGSPNKEMTGVALPQNDIVALGKALQSQGLRVSEHPSFGGVSPVHKGRAHYEGRAIDINIGKGVSEASDPVLGAKFDRLADQLAGSGYKVFWRESGKYGAAGHNNHLHAEIPVAGEKSKGDYEAITTPSSTSPTTPTGPAAPSTSGEMVSAMDSRLTSGDPSQILSAAREQLASQGIILPMAGMMDGEMPMLPSIGGLGGIMGLLGSAFTDMIGPSLSELPLQENKQFTEQLIPQIQSAQNLQSAAIEEKVIQSMQYKPPETEKTETEISQFVQSPERHFPQGSFSEYNVDNHLYPEWASMIYDVYGKFTGEKGGNIKTSLA